MARDRQLEEQSANTSYSEDKKRNIFSIKKKEKKKGKERITKNTNDDDKLSDSSSSDEEIKVVESYPESYHSNNKSLKYTTLS